MTETAPPPARRADARLNQERILDAATTCLSADPAASVGDIAKAAGLGRVTLYGHFPSREQLVEATLMRTLGAGDKVLEGIDLTGDPAAALRELVGSSWRLIAQSSAVLAAAQQVLPPERIRQLHAEPERRVLELIARGQQQGRFRTDLPTTWLSSVLHHVLKGAASDVANGRLDEHDAAWFISETVLSAYLPGPHHDV